MLTNKIKIKAITMSKPFKLRSGNSPMFKKMGSSPMHHPHETMREAKSHSKNVIHPEEAEEKKDSSSPTSTQPKPSVEKPKKKKKRKEAGKKEKPETPSFGVIRPRDGNYKDSDGNFRDKNGNIIHEDEMVG